jgi:hypothetical protein
MELLTAKIAPTLIWKSSAPAPALEKISDSQKSPDFSRKLWICRKSSAQLQRSAPPSPPGIMADRER